MSKVKAGSHGTVTEKSGRKLVIKKEPDVESDIPLNQLASVHVLLSNTVEMNGGWVKAEIGITLPCHVSKVDSTFNKLFEDVRKKVSDKIESFCEVGRVI